MARIPGISDDDRQLFRDSVGVVTKIHNDKHEPLPKPIEPRPEQTEKDEKKRNEDKVQHLINVDEKLEEQLEIEEQEINDDDDMRHIDFRA